MSKCDSRRLSEIHWPLAKRFAKSLARRFAIDRDLAVSEASVAILKAEAKALAGEVRGKFSTYLYTCILNRLRDLIRADSRRILLDPLPIEASYSPLGTLSDILPPELIPTAEALIRGERPKGKASEIDLITEILKREYPEWASLASETPPTEAG